MAEKEKGWIGKRIDAAVDNLVNWLMTAAIASISVVAALVWLFWRRFLSLCNSFHHWLVQPVVIVRWFYVLLLLVGGFVVVVVLAGLLMSLRRPGKTFQNYVKDTILNLPFKWRWIGSDLDFLSVHIYCPHCDRIIPIEQSDYSSVTNIACDKCGLISQLEGNWRAVVGRVAREIDLRVRNGEWKNKC